ncbi:cytidylate kinase family protein [Candidatus Pacebacteria bacterium]|nr:cytidylate kinase family protein [Candidatus Paceibacterota bacterium]
MERPHIITVSGKPGSGKSSTSDKVAELLGYSRYSAGDMTRKYIEKHKITLAEFNKKAQDDHALDEMIDEGLRNMRDEKDIVIDSRLGFYWIPESFKVYLDLDLEVATARIYRNIDQNESRQKSGEGGNSMGEVARNVKQRLNSEIRRYRNLYGINPYDASHFDLVIDTSNHSPQTVATTVFDHYKKWQHSDSWRQVKSEVPLGYSFKNEF